MNAALYNEAVPAGTLWQFRIHFDIPGNAPLDQCWYVLGHTEEEVRKKVHDHVERVCADNSVNSSAAFITVTAMAGNIEIFPPIQLTLADDLKQYKLAVCLVPVE